MWYFHSRMPRSSLASSGLSSKQEMTAEAEAKRWSPPGPAPAPPGPPPAGARPALSVPGLRLLKAPALWLPMKSHCVICRRRVLANERPRWTKEAFLEEPAELCRTPSSQAGLQGEGRRGEGRSRPDCEHGTRVRRLRDCRTLLLLCMSPAFPPGGSWGLRQGASHSQVTTLCRSPCWGLWKPLPPCSLYPSGPRDAPHLSPEGL